MDIFVIEYEWLLLYKLAIEFDMISIPSLEGYEVLKSAQIVGDPVGDGVSAIPSI